MQRYTHFSEELFVIHHGASPTYKTQEHIYIFQLPCWLKLYTVMLLETQGEVNCSPRKDLPISLAKQLKLMQIPCLRSDCYPYSLDYLGSKSVRNCNRNSHILA